MEIVSLFSALFEDTFLALLLIFPRFQGFMATSQLFPSTAMPRIVRTSVLITLCLPLVPVHLHLIHTMGQTPFDVAVYITKEYALGYLLGTLVGWIFWVVQCMGALIDNQRGAAIASSIDPLQGHETSPLGNMLSQVFLTYVFTSGGVLYLIGLFYNSFLLWPVDKGLPLIGDGVPEMFVSLFDMNMRLIFLFASPIVIIMFLAEFSLAIVSRFAPQVQVFVLAMPIKSVLADFVMILYLGVLLPYAHQQLAKSQVYIDQFYAILSTGQTVLEGGYMNWVKPPPSP